MDRCPNRRARACAWRSPASPLRSTSAMKKAPTRCCSSTTFSVSRRRDRKCRRCWAACRARSDTSPTWRPRWVSCRSASRRRRRDQSQRFHVAEQFTGSPGRYVKVADTVKGFKDIVEGKYDDIPEQAFYMKGTIDEVLQAAEKMKAAA